MIGAVIAALGCAICFYGPDNMAFDRVGHIYITDTDGKQHSRVIKLSPDGKLLAQWHVFARGSGDRTGPEGIALAAGGMILVTDAGSERILELSPDGEVLGTFASESGSFLDLGHVVIDRAGNVYVSQAAPNTIEKFAADGTLLARWRRQRGPQAGDWGGPETIATQPNGNLVVEDWRNRRVEILDPLGNTVTAFGHAGRGPGEFINTAGLGTDSDGNIYVADMGLHRVQKFDPQGRFLKIIANTPKSVLFETGPSAVAVDRNGDVYSPDGLSLVKYTQDGELLARWR
jgi:tripartite motif-containing protein 71